MNFLALCLTALGSFGALFLVAKFIGHKQIAQLDFFDYITGISIGSIAAEMATELEEPWKPLSAMVVYGGSTLLLSIVSKKFPRSHRAGGALETADRAGHFRRRYSAAARHLHAFSAHAQTSERHAHNPHGSREAVL